ncbi:response regulator [Anaeroselena agilis]|uniref:Response regulator n=1 Tax=Anaeroselena agilis TaxID=3063788 RepID=A0ABU3NT45_9FIRM|nr:response regulator [Selenomonadales bacterium 4137-cl]
MAAIKVMVVDDSPFSRTILTDILTEGGYEVVGEAESLESLVETYSQCRPDVVTMDIAMPDADGFECTNVLRLHDPAAKIILVSSMKDEETEAEARRIGVMGYVQKPVEAESLLRVVERVVSPDTLYQDLETWGIDMFKEALTQSITRMTKTTATISEEGQGAQISSRGLTVVIGISGQYPGTMILDLPMEQAEKMAEVILRRPAKKSDEVVAMLAEFANVVGGVACSLINKKDKQYKLRVSPPSVFYGTPTEVVSPNLPVRSLIADTDFGRIRLSVGFKKGSVLWM